MRSKKKKNEGVMILILKSVLIWGGILLCIYAYEQKRVILDTNYDVKALYDEGEKEVVLSQQTNLDILYETTKTVVGISKLENVGTSIFGNVGENQLGLGTGIIVTSEGHILSNAHVTGEKFSRCYVTLENGITYTGKVVWSNSNLDLSITKIEAVDLEYATLGDSSKIKLR